MGFEGANFATNDAFDVPFKDLKKAGPQGPLRFGKRRDGPTGPLRFGKRSSLDYSPLAAQQPHYFFV
ncbi:hypothetical protein ANCCAN_05925 [Ancylostoma caninum]|uniref:Uncharacterized protein n=1 Tax=Ancylostoma caninum TaxID=29170 RepID=A0A368GUD9_ANCCA|nr:hypothetical protein ANCCAN_05925 [Ancylostoma caninum]